MMKAGRLNSAGLLVSVRSHLEAEAAVAGGAAIVDVKEPSRGSLGRANSAVMEAVVDAVAGRSIVSAAMGELVEEGNDHQRMVPGIKYVKFGLGKCRNGPDWQHRLLKRRASIETASPAKLVAVAYADSDRAEAPAVAEVHDFAVTCGFDVLLIDTWRKDGTTLLDWLDVATLNDLCATARCAGVQVALAGSLGLTEIAKLRSARPHWFAVRGAACVAGKRVGQIDEERVRQLVAALGDRMETTGKEQPCEMP